MNRKQFIKSIGLGAIVAAVGIKAVKNLKEEPDNYLITIDGVRHKLPLEVGSWYQVSSIHTNGRATETWITPCDGKGYSTYKKHTPQR